MSPDKLGIDPALVREWRMMTRVELGLGPILLETRMKRTKLRDWRYNASMPILFVLPLSLWMQIKCFRISIEVKGRCS